VAQLGKRQTLDFGSGHDLRVLGSRPGSGSVLSGDSQILSLPLSLLPSPKINKYINKIFFKKII